MPEKRNVESENNRAIDSAAAHMLHLLQRCTTEKPWGSVTVTYHWKAGLLTRRIVTEEESELLLLPSQQND